MRSRLLRSLMGGSYAKQRQARKVAIAGHYEDNIRHTP